MSTIKRRGLVVSTAMTLSAMLLLQGCAGTKSANSPAAESGTTLDQIALHVDSGNRARQLTWSAGDQAEPAFSPDNQQLVYQNNSDGNWELYTIAIDGGEPTRLTNTPSNEEDPSFSPDGRWIVCTSHSPSLDENPARDILLVSRNGEEQRLLVQNSADDWYPRFSVDGQFVYFCSDRTDGRNVSDEDRHSAIFKVEVSSGAVTQLTSGDDESAPCPLPSASFACRDGQGQMVRFSEDGSQQVLSDRDWHFSAPEHSMGGWAICASEDLDAASKIYISGPDFVNLQAIDQGERSADRGPSISSDGKQLAFYGRVNGQWDLFIMSLGG